MNFLASGTLTFCLNWLALIPWRKATAAHWTERARLISPVRVSGALNIWMIPPVISLAEFLAGMVSLPGCFVPAAAGWLGAILATYPLDREILPRFTFRSWLRLVITSWSIRAGFLGVLAACGLLMPEEPGLATAAIGGGMLLFILALDFGLFVWVLRRARVLRPPDGRLLAIVAGTARRMGVREPVTWLLDSPLAQAAAMPVTCELMFTSRLLEIESDEEISSICAHEMGHLTESKGVLARRIVGSLTLYPLIFLRPALNFGPAAVCAIFGLMWLLVISNRNLSRRMEKRADKIAVENQAEAGIYARALEKLYCDNLLPAVSSSNARTHPHLYDRLLAAGIQPEYARPSKPEKMAWTGALVCVAFGALIGIVLARL
jgi:Zn-dependent protease with chaperone function